MKNWILRIIFLIIPLFGLYYYYQFFGSDDNGGLSCMFYRETGWLCPGCGGQRALHALLHGHFREALEYNIMILVYFPLLAFLYIALVEVYIVKNDKFLQKYAIPNWFAYSFLALIIVFFIVRNIW
ncbi:DUF2752 domain-containing protein [Myroides odoratimimus]|uniref:DUF2752 domain-containing protein n=1 Tax=Myroides odoratimimus TaxID=76832 RepID=UPI002576DDBE|nr:DUF2752 domain-containing protein [Myroides odoratimimus]MDM1530605.1 DUF2752 domain-containing protein [Myroides odoratimimus]